MSRTASRLSETMSVVKAETGSGPPTKYSGTEMIDGRAGVKVARWTHLLYSCGTAAADGRLVSMWGSASALEMERLSRCPLPHLLSVPA